MTAISKTAKTILGLAAAASIATTMLPSEAEAGWRGRRNWAIGAGVVGGIAAAALIAGAANAHYGHGYYAPAYAAPDCYWVKQRRVTWDGFVVVRNVRVCD
jgi:MFS family permease